MHYVDNSYDAACILDKSTLQPTYGNGKFKKMFARQVRGSLPKLLASVHPANQALEQTVSDKLADLDTKQTQHRFCIAASTNEELELTTVVTDDPDFLLCTIRFNSTKVNETFDDQKTLKESRLKIDSLMDLSNLPIIEMSGTGIIKNASFSICNNLGISKEDIEGRPIHEFIAEKDHESFDQFLQLSLIHI